MPKLILSAFNKALPSMDNAPYVFLSGQFSYPGREKELIWLDKTGCKHRCFSYVFIVPEGFFYCAPLEEQYEICKERGIGIMIDSSAFSFRRFIVKASSGKFRAKFAAHGNKVEEFRKATIDGYYEFCKKNAHLWDFYINFDYVRQADKVYKMQKELEQKGMRPVPVFHGDMGIDWMKRYIDEGYKFIGIGAGRHGRKHYLDAVFDLATKHNVCLHGFARTSFQDIMRYPWLSLDSTTWIRTSAYGKIIVPTGNITTMAQIHVSKQRFIANGSYSTMEPSVKKVIRGIVEKEGFDFDGLQTSEFERTMWNGWVMSSWSKWKFKRETYEQSWGKLF